MKSMRFTRLMLALVVGAVLFVGGCAGAFTPERARMRRSTINADWDHMVDDVDWVLGLTEPTRLYDEGLE